MQQEKTIIVEALLERINSSPFVLVADYHGLTVDEFAELRNQLRETGALFHVTKNSYIKRVVAEADLPGDLNESLVGQTAIVTGEEDVCAAAKVLKTFHKEKEKAKVKMGVLDGKLLREEDVAKLAELPSKEQLLGQLLGLLQAPATNLARLLNEPGSQLARVMHARSEKSE